MRKLLILSAFSIFTLSSFGTNELKKEDLTIKMTKWNIYCNGVYSGNITCDCDYSTAYAIALGVCGNN